MGTQHSQLQLEPGHFMQTASHVMQIRQLQIHRPFTQPSSVQVRAERYIGSSEVSDLVRLMLSCTDYLPRYLPKLGHLRRLHLADVSLSSEQVIALAEILPENKSLAHINLLENPELVRLADARTEDMQEEACALYASLLAAVRVSSTLVKIDIDDPSPESGELLKAIANRVVAYTMRNLQGAPDIRDASLEDSAPKLAKYPDVLRHLVGHEEDFPIIDENDTSNAAPDEDYVIGGTGVVKALACVLKNRGDDSRRQSGDLAQEINDGVASPQTELSHGKAKDMSKHLLAVARKIQARLKPALATAKASAREDQAKYRKLNMKFVL